MWVVGMMGSGKTEAGRVAAKSLGVEFFDTDDVVAERMGCSIAQFWGERGEAAFREIEKVATASLAVRAGVKATGGGVVLEADNRNILTASPKVVWLRAEPETLAARIEGQQDRPLLASAGGSRAGLLKEMLDHRSPLYAEVASHQVNTERLDTAGVALALEEIWRS